LSFHVIGRRECFIHGDAVPPVGVRVRPTICPKSVLKAKLRIYTSMTGDMILSDGTGYEEIKSGRKKSGSGSSTSSIMLK
jgi:hypothetical protein